MILTAVRWRAMSRFSFCSFTGAAAFRTPWSKSVRWSQAVCSRISAASLISHLLYLSSIRGRIFCPEILLSKPPGEAAHFRVHLVSAGIIVAHLWCMQWCFSTQFIVIVSHFLKHFLLFSVTDFLFCLIISFCLYFNRNNGLQCPY